MTDGIELHQQSAYPGTKRCHLPAELKTCSTPIPRWLIAGPGRDAANPRTRHTCMLDWHLGHRLR
jgi:hypothetical protein